MKLRIKLHVYANLREHLGGAASVETEFEPGETIHQVLSRTSLPADQVHIVFINNRPAQLDHALQGDERIDLFSAVGGG
jgi:molybdopterin converting factor small subunit